MTLIGRASEEGLEKVALEVLKPHFHQEPFQKRKVRIDARCAKITSSTMTTITPQLTWLLVCDTADAA